MIAPNLGSEFVPRLSEGAIAINVVRLAGTDLDESIRAQHADGEGHPRRIPRRGRARLEPHRHRRGRHRPDGRGTDRHVHHPQAARPWWTKAVKTQAELTELIEKELRDMPGQRLAFSQPIEHAHQRDDLRRPRRPGRQGVRRRLRRAGREGRRDRGSAPRPFPAAPTSAVEQITGQPVLQIKINQDEIARYGVPAKAVLDLVEVDRQQAAGRGRRRATALPAGGAACRSDCRTDPEAIGRACCRHSDRRAQFRSSAGRHSAVVEGPSTITREWGQRRIVVPCNVRGRDMGSFVAEAQRRLAEQVPLPPGRYHVEWGGQFEHLERARHAAADRRARRAAV